MNLKEAMYLAFEYLEQKYHPKWRTGKGSKQKLLEAYSQDEIPKAQYLGYQGNDGIRHAFHRAIPDSGKPKNILWETWLLSNIGMFQCFMCKQVLVLELKVSTKSKYCCKSCDNIKTKTRRETVQDYVFSVLNSSCCADCGETNPIILEFDHLDPSNKKFNIGDAYSKPLEEVKLEVSKCDIVCANCHRIRTAKTYNYFKHRSLFS